MTDERYVIDTTRDKAVQRIERRGDSFDIGEYADSPQEQDIIVRVLQNPNKLAEMLNLNDKQAENLRAAITGAGAGLSSKFLANAFGDEVAGAIGGFLGGFVAKRVIGKRS